MVSRYVILVAAGVVGLRFNPPVTTTLRWVTIILLAAFAVPLTLQRMTWS
jgi:hypothetical protein